MENKAQLINQLLNFFWTILGFSAVLIYWLSNPTYPWLYLILLVSFLTLLLPSRYYTISKSKIIYERLGVKTVKRFVQDGDLVNKLFGSTSSNTKAKPARATKNLNQYLRSLIMYERFHFLCFIFFLLTAIQGIKNGDYQISIFILISNIFYNFYPIILQQYNRLRILKLLKL
jgi:hypothetical protein